jgi:hypothetical protein
MKPSPGLGMIFTNTPQSLRRHLVYAHVLKSTLLRDLPTRGRRDVRHAAVCLGYSTSCLHCWHLPRGHARQDTFALHTNFLRSAARRRELV